MLVIEDDEDLREVLTLHLDRFFHVTQAASVEQALAFVRTGRCDVVVCDLMMPSGGAEVWLQHCVQIDPRLDECTILLTGGATNASAASLIRSREDKVLFKPINISELRPLIERLAHV